MCPCVCVRKCLHKCMYECRVRVHATNFMLQWSRSKCRLLVTYGVTEVTVYQTIHNATAAAAAAAAAVADEQHSSRGYMIGKALQGVGVAVVDSNDALVERGQPGQIVLFGPQVMRTFLCACLCVCVCARDFLSVLQLASCLCFS